MSILIASRRRSIDNVRAANPAATILDVTSKGPEPWRRFSPFFPHGSIPVPLSPGLIGESVEGIWQGLKVFEHEDVDLTKLAVVTMKGIKRSVRRLGPVRGHRVGTELLSYRAAREKIYVPAYQWVLAHRLAELVADIARLSDIGPVVLLDYETNADIEDLTKPLSHAALVKQFVEATSPRAPSCGER